MKPILAVVALIGVSATLLITSRSDATRDQDATARRVDPAADKSSERPDVVPPHREARSLMTEPDKASVATKEERETVDPQVAAVASAVKDIEEQADLAIDGIVEINRLLKQMESIAELPISPDLDPEYQDSDGVAYRFMGTPEGVEAHLLVHLAEQGSRSGPVKTLEVNLETRVGTSEMYRGAMREGARINLHFNHDEAGNPLRLGLLTSRRVSLADSRRNGIDGYTGEFITGVNYISNLQKAGHFSAASVGIKNGHPKTSSGPDPLATAPESVTGDLVIDPAIARALFEAVHSRAKEAHYQ